MNLRQMQCSRFERLKLLSPTAEVFRAEERPAAMLAVIALTAADMQQAARISCHPKSLEVDLSVARNVSCRCRFRKVFMHFSRGAQS
jgi:hypothetical protein